MVVALVTGSTRGLGRATAQALARAGHTVIVTGRDGDDVRRSCSSMDVPDDAVDGIVMDVRDSDSIAAAVNCVRDAHGRLDVLVNNAGILPEAGGPGTESQTTAELFHQTFATNVFGAVAVTEAFLPLLRASTAGRIVNVSSTMGSLTDQSDPASVYYAAGVPAYRSSRLRSTA